MTVSNEPERPEQPELEEQRIDREDGRSLRSGFLHHAARAPEAPALGMFDRVVSYGELEQRARRWAGAIVERLGRPARRVGVLGHRSEIAYAGALAALFAGAAFVPLNPMFPLDRTRTMLEAAELDALIVDEAAVVQLAQLLYAGGSGGSGVAPGRPRVVLLPAIDGPRAVADATGLAAGRAIIGAGELASTPPLAALPPVAVDDIAYLLFTSGSTGQPKGVPVTHGNVVAFLDVVARRYAIAPSDRFSQTFDQTFDLSVFDLFLPWSTGASVYAMRPIDLLAPARFVAQHALTIWFSVPSVPALMRRKGFLRPASMPSLRWSLFCGEPLPQKTAEDWQAAAPGSIVENLYGPTELTIACFAYRWSPERSPAECRDGLVPIGRPFPGLAAAVIDDRDQVSPEGEPGELWVSGPQTVPGYWRNAATTAARFVVRDDLAAGTKRFYRTGDRVVRLPSGDYAYLGRVDNQVKVLGFRVELGDVEAALRAAPGVVEAVAVAWPLEAGGAATGLVAFITGHGGHGGSGDPAIDPSAVLASVRAAVPDYMVPRELRIVGELPLNANGKVDRRALLAELARSPGA
jgi:amino acid adenylation domain-containing protein